MEESRKPIYLPDTGSLAEEVKAFLRGFPALDEWVESSFDMPVAEELMTEEIGIALRTIQVMRQNGQIRSYVVGKKIFYIPSEFRDDIRRFNIYS